jgi:hypothetical protein
VTDRLSINKITSNDLDQLYAERDAARATNRRLNLRAQKLESELATYRRAVDQWDVSERGTYVPLRTIAQIAKAAGRNIENPRWLLHYQRIEQAETALARITAYLDSTDGPCCETVRRALRGIIDGPAEQPRTTPDNPATSKEAADNPADDNGPTVAEAATDDRRYWDSEKAGEK